MQIGKGLTGRAGRQGVVIYFCLNTHTHGGSQHILNPYHMGDLPLFMILGGLLEWIILNPDSDRMYVCDETLVVEFLFLRNGFIIQLFYIKTGVVFFLMFGRKISLSSLVNAFFTRNLSQFFFFCFFVCLFSSSLLFFRNIFCTEICAFSLRWFLLLVLQVFCFRV